MSVEQLTVIIALAFFCGVAASQAEAASRIARLKHQHDIEISGIKGRWVEDIDRCKDRLDEALRRSGPATERPHPPPALRLVGGRDSPANGRTPDGETG